MTEKLKILLEIYSIPLKEQWEGWAEPTSYSAYKYWRNLGLIDNRQFEETLSTLCITSNDRLLNFFRSIDYHFKPKYYYGGQVADIGSGFGFITFWLILSGARKVHSIGDPNRISQIERLNEAAVKNGLIDKDRLVVTPKFVNVGDETLGHTISPSTLDLVLLNDTLEHINLKVFPWLVKSVYNDLKPNGIFISKQQNTDSPAMLSKLERTWERGEREIYIPQRLEAIRKINDKISDEEARELAIKTRGLDSEDFRTAIQLFLDKNIFPNHDLNIPPIDLNNDVPYEGNTSIDRISAEFKKHKFKRIRVYPDLRSSRRSRYLQPIAFLFPSLFLSSHIFDQTTVFQITK